MKIGGGRLDFLAPHLLRSPLLRPGFVRLSLRLGAARKLPSWARLQFTNSGISTEDLNLVLGRVTSLESWVEEWEKLGIQHEDAGAAELERGETAAAARELLTASAAYDFAQYVMFVDIRRKRALHESCVRAYAKAAPLLDPPARLFQISYRRNAVKGWLRVPVGRGPAPVVVLFHGTNGVKEELHWWTESLLERGLATLTFDGPGLGETFHRLSMVVEPRPLWNAIYQAIESEPLLDPGAVGLVGNSLGAYMALRMAAHDPHVRAVAAVSPPYSISIYWNLTMGGMRRELAALYNTTEAQMAAVVARMTLAGILPQLRAPLLVVGGGHDLITPGEEARHIFEEARCERQFIYYPAGAHDCFNVLGDLRPRVAGWLVAHLASARRTRALARVPAAPAAVEDADAWMAAEAVDPDFADELRGEAAPLRWRPVVPAPMPAHWSWWRRSSGERVQIVFRHANGDGVLSPA